VVFEAGLGNDSTIWKSVAGPIAAFGGVVLDDRAKLGRSLPMANENSAIAADNVASNLRALVAAAISPPYVLVGHLLGGLLVQPDQPHGSSPCARSGGSGNSAVAMTRKPARWPKRATSASSE
jgi:hypothetical protein